MPLPSLQPARAVERMVASQPTIDGAGVRLTRVLTQTLQRRLDPALMLNALGSDQPGDDIAGFPDHPHRGFETINHMLEGRIGRRHRDKSGPGNEGVVADGGVPWMTTGRGVIHRLACMCASLPGSAMVCWDGAARRYRAALPRFAL